MLQLSDIFGSAYLEAMTDTVERIVISDPENAFNHGQHFEARSTYGALLRRARAPMARAIAQQGDVALATEQPELAAKVERFAANAVHMSTRFRGRGVLVELAGNTSLADLRAEQPGLMPRAVTKFWPAWLRMVSFDMQATLSLLAAGHRTIEVTVLDALNNAPLEGTYVQLIYSRAQKIGVEVYTDAFGKARLFVPAAYVTAEIIAIQPKHTYWPMAIANPDISGPAIDIRAVNIGTFQVNALRKVWSQGTPADGAGVKVAVIDSGVGPHPDLVVKGGANMVVTDDPAEATDFQDNGFGHGTHVAGIIAGRGIVNPAFVGLAPGVELFSYRVIAKGKRSADDIALADAIETAIEQGCHLINISLGSDKPVREIGDAISKAFAFGAVVIAAAGNGARQPVEYPASHPACIGVSALGIEATYPANSMAGLAFAPPKKSSAQIMDGFIAAFSNVGSEIDVTAPGVGIISTYPHGNYAVCDGTSMAAPAVTGFAARLLSQNIAVRDMPATQERSVAMVSLILSAAKQLGFGATYEGKGLPF
jgi:subtilisin family serine protease